MSYQKLREEIKSGAFSPAYHFFGPEEYLKKHYANLLRTSLVDEAFSAFNLVVFDGAATADSVITAISTPPMMAEKKLVILKETGIFSQSAANKEQWQTLFADFPDYACLLAIEEKFDKRNAVYKAFSAIALPVEFLYRSRGDLAAWVTKKLRAAGKTMSRKTMELFLDAAGVEMFAVDAAFEKVTAYVGTRSEITEADVDALLVRAIITKEYVLTDALLAGKKAAAFSALEDLRLVRTDPIRILTVIASNYLSVLKAKILLGEGQSHSAVSAALKLPSPFLAKKTTDTAAKCSIERLRESIRRIKETDYKIKIGLEAPDTGVTRLCADLLHL